MLSESIAILAATAPPGLSKKQALAEVNSKIIMLESQLGISSRLMPILNSAKAIARLTELEGQLAAKGLPPTPAALAPAAAAAVAAIAAAPGQPEILMVTLAEYRKMDAAIRLQFSQDGGALAQADFNQLSALAKMQHCRAGGKILESTEASKRIVAPGHVAVTPKP
jgi:hypothetical protein